MRKSIVPALWLCLLAVVPLAGADVLYMKNGDRLSGTVVRKTDTKLVFETPYAGKVSVEWEEVDRLETEQPIRVYFDDGSSVSGLVQEDESGDLVILDQEAEAETPLALEKVTYVNPPDDLSGEGYTWKGAINVGLDYERGNNDNDNYNVDVDIAIRGLGVRYKLIGDYNRELSQGETTKDNWFANGSYNRDMRGKWYAFTNLFGEQDQFKDLDLRASASVGPGYRFWDSEALSLSVEAGPGVTVERFSGDEQEDDEYPIARWGVNYDQYVYKRVLQAFHDQTGFYNLQETANYIFRSRTGLRIPLTNHLQTTLRFDFDYDSDAAPGTDKEDYRYLITLGYKW